MTSTNDPEKEHPHSQTEYDPAAEDRDDTAQIIRTVIDELHTLIDEYKTRGEQEATNQKRNFRLSAITAFLLLVYTTVTVLLWCETRRATNTARQALQLSVRAQLSIMRLEPPDLVPGQKGVELNARIRNGGPGAALNIGWRTRIDTCPVEDIPSCFEKCPRSQPAPRIINLPGLESGEERSITYEFPRRTISAGEADAISKGIRVLYFCGVHRYTNLFSDLQSFPFCSVYDKDVKKWAGCKVQSTEEQGEK